MINGIISHGSWDEYLTAPPYRITQTYESHSDPCEHCSNNPKNNPHASGVCWCVLPYLNNVIY